MREKCFYGNLRESLSLLVVMVALLSCRRTLASSFQPRRSESEHSLPLCLLEMSSQRHCCGIVIADFQPSVRAVTAGDCR